MEKKRVMMDELVLNSYTEDQVGIFFILRSMGNPFGFVNLRFFINNLTASFRDTMEGPKLENALRSDRIKMGQGPFLLILDYGILVPPTRRGSFSGSTPHMSSSMRDILQLLCRKHKCIVISGKSSKKLSDSIGPHFRDHIGFIASNGFDIRTPHFDYLPFTEFADVLYLAYTVLQDELKDFPVIIENNEFCVSVNYAQVNESDWFTLQKVIFSCIYSLNECKECEHGGEMTGEKSGENDIPGHDTCTHKKKLEVCSSKLAWEIRPLAPWNRGTATSYVLNRLLNEKESHENKRSSNPNAAISPTTVISIGDDLIDESVFSAVIEAEKSGKCLAIPILVSKPNQPSGTMSRQTLARYYLRDIQEAETFLKGFL